MRAEVTTESQQKTEGLVNQLQTHFKTLAQGRITELEEVKSKVAALEQVFTSDADYRHTSYKVS